MEQNSNATKKSLFSKFHKEGFTWHDSIFIIALVFLFLFFVFAILSYALRLLVLALIPSAANDAYITFFLEYFVFITVWITFLGYIMITKYNRPIIRALSKEAKGNTVKMLLLGLLIGFCMNALGIVMALLHGDIHLYFGDVDIFKVILLFPFVFIQSSAEELICRSFLYQRFLKGYKSPLVAIVCNGFIFMAIHLGNNGVSAPPLINIFLLAVFFSLIVYYFDSVWMPMGIHAAWNFTQNIIFGLPNSGIVSQTSILHLDAASGTSSVFYDPNFGIEGAFFVSLIAIVSIIITVYLGKKKNTPSLDVWTNT